MVLLLTSLLSAEVLSLKEAELRAMNNGFDIRIDSIDDISRSWQKKNVIAGYLPKVDYNANLMRLDDSTAYYSALTFVESVVPRPNILNHEFTLSQPITNGGAEIVAINLAKHTKRAQELGYSANRADLILLVRQRYFELIKAKAQIDIAERDLQWAQKNLANAQIRFESGVLSEIDLLRWKRSIIDKRSFLMQSKALDEYQQAELKVAMGIDPLSESTIETDSFEIYETYYHQFELDSGLIDSNLRLQSLDGYREITHDQRKLALTSALPKVNGFGSWGKDQKWGDGADVITSYAKWSVGIGLNVPLFSGFRNSTAYLEKKHDAIKADIDYEKNRNMMAVNLIRITKFIEAAKIGAESAREQLKLNKKAFEIMNDRYTLGQINQVDLLEMNQAVAGSRLEYITRTLEALYLYSEYQNAIGKLEVIQ